MPYITDKEFGEVRVYRSGLAKSARLKITGDGRLVGSLPLGGSLQIIARLIHDSRDELRRIIAATGTADKRPAYTDGNRISRARTLRIKEVASVKSIRSVVTPQALTLYVPADMAYRETAIRLHVTEALNGILRQEAKDYIPRRVKELADQHGFTVTAIRFNNAGTRWGSCSSQGSLNFNIGLMKLPDSLIDYVIVHELCHTRQMNHSPHFWGLVEDIMPRYKSYRRELKLYSPLI